MEELEKLKERLNKAAEVFKEMKTQLEDKDAQIQSLMNEIKDLNGQIKTLQSNNNESIDKVGKVYSEVKQLNKKLESDFNIFG